MINIQKILNAVLAKNVFEYILLDSTFCVVDTSIGLNKYLEDVPQKGDDIFHYCPELVGLEDEIEKIFADPARTYMLESMHKNEYYLNLYIEYFDKNSVLLLLHNITDTALSQQKILQYSNESILINNTLQKMLDKQNAFLFVTHKKYLTYANEKFMHYFHIDKIEDFARKHKPIYKYFDETLTSYDALYERVNSKEEYIVIQDDTFILKASMIEDTHTLFTLTKVTELSHEIEHDSLTGAYLKQVFTRKLEAIIRQDEEAVVVVVDLDDFKNINDTYGHQIGDKVLKEFVMILEKNIRSDDMLARWGGEEFLLLLQKTNLENALKKIERLRVLIETHTFAEIPSLTASFGVAWKEKSDDLHALLYRADKALYEAKAKGKNCIVFKKR